MTATLTLNFTLILTLMVEPQFANSALAQVGVTLRNIAGGSLRRMATMVTPLLIDRFLYYTDTTRRLAGAEFGSNTWNTVEIKNYATVINDIFNTVSLAPWRIRQQ